MTHHLHAHLRYRRDPATVDALERLTVRLVVRATLPHASVERTARCAPQANAIAAQLAAENPDAVVTITARP